MIILIIFDSFGFITEQKQEKNKKYDVFTFCTNKA